MPLAEILKTDHREFGGFQSGRMLTKDVEVRFCCGRGCSERGRVQIQVPQGFRILCGRHAVIQHMMFLGLMGDPVPVAEVRNYADTLGVDWEALLRSEPKHPTLPEHFICLRCGGGYLVETQGMYKGKRFIHTCGD